MPVVAAPDDSMVIARDDRLSGLYGCGRPASGHMPSPDIPEANAVPGTRSASDARWGFRLMVLLAVALAARAITFGNPLVHVDEQYYFVVGDAWRHGAIPYVDVWDRKPIGLFLIYLLAALAGPVTGIYAYQAMALVAVVATALQRGRR